MQIRWYGLMFLIGFTLSFHGMKKISTLESKPVEKIDSLLIYLIFGTTIGARLAHCLFYDPSYYFSHPIQILKIWEGGLASHGGIIGAIVALWLFVKKNQDFSFWWLLDRITIFGILIGSFVRIGNWMNSEIVGKPTDGSWGVIFDRVDQVPRHPTQLYESFCYLLVFIISMKIYLKYKEKSPTGLLFGSILIAGFVCRFFIEFFKEVQSPWEKHLPLDMGQLLSIPFVAIGIYFVIKSRYFLNTQIK